jgi:CHASE3 domain sensor protein
MQVKTLWIFEFIIISVISVATGWFYKDLLTRATEALSHTNSVIDSIDELFILVLRSESAVKSYSTFGSKQYLDFYEKAKDDYPEMILRLEIMVENNPRQLQNVRDFHAAVLKKKEFLDEVIEHKKTNTLQSYQGQIKGKNLMDSVRIVYDALKFEEYRILEIRTKELENYSNNSFYIIPAGNLLNFLLLVSSYYTVRPPINEKRE